MRPSADRLLDCSISGLVLAALGTTYLSTLAPGVTWANDGADSGDLIAAAATLGIAHPTGYPTYLLLARLFQLIPCGDLAFRTTLLSAVAALLAVVCVYALVRLLLASGSWYAAVAAGLAALSAGLAPVFWSQAVIAEVYTLNGLFAAVLMLFMLQSIRASDVDSGWSGRLRALFAGLALGNHITIALLAAVWLVLAVVSAPSNRLRQAARLLPWLGGGLLVYLYLPLRAAAHPPVNWGNPVDWAGFWWEISGQPYRGLAFGVPRAFLYGRVEAWAALLIQQFGALGLGIGLFGLLYDQSHSRLFVWLTGGLALAYSIFAITYDSADSYAYMIPVYLIFAIWIGLGVERILGAVGRRSRWAARLIVLALVVSVVWRASTVAQRVDASGDRRAIVYARGVLAALPASAIMATSSDLDTFPLWYYHYALGERPDIVVVVEPLLEFSWYRDNLRAVYPALRIPERASSSWLEAIASANSASGRLCRSDPGRSERVECGGP